MEKTIEKIRRLLRLGTSSNKHEAQSALAKAAEIARRHSIDLGTIKADEERARVIESTFGAASVYEVVNSAAISVCMGIFNVGCITCGPKITFIGLPHNVEAARFAHGFAVEQCGRDLKEFRAARRKLMGRGQRITKGMEHSFCQGWAVGVRQRYKKEIEAAEPDALPEQSSAIILREQQKEVEDYIRAAHADAKKARARRFKEDGLALGMGHKAGGRVSINRPIEGAPAVAGQLAGGVA